MDENLDQLSNLCTDLVSLRSLEPGVAFLLSERAPGAWTQVRELYDRAGVSFHEVADVQAAWLPSPTDPEYAVLLFYDDDSKWSLTAEYNAARLLGRALPSPVAAAG